jgi:2'-5' RNA ligase
MIETFSGKGGAAILLMLPQDFSSRLIEWGQKNIPSDKLSGISGKGYEKSPHITLATGIIDEAPEKAFKLLEKQGPFKVQLGEIDCFHKPDKGYDVLKIAVDSQVAHMLNEGILENLEINNPILPYSPHITLAYIRPHSCGDLIGSDEFKGLEVPIEAYVYSDRETGGRVVPFKQSGPLKESLDYGSPTEYPILEIAKFLDNNDLFVKAMSARNIARTVISMRHGNKN